MLIAVVGHFISYTFIVVIIGDVVGVPGARLAWLLAAFGAAGLIAMPLLARPVDHRPKLVTGGCMAAMSAAFAVLAALSIGGHHTTGTTVAGAAAIVLWGRWRWRCRRCCSRRRCAPRPTIPTARRGCT